jgi:CheY-like chemotaxis protein
MGLIDSDGQAPWPGLRVLLADDQEINRKEALRMLEQLGCDANVVADGSEALRALETTCYDVVLIDVHMPVMDGVDATVEYRRREQARGAKKRTPLVALTSLSEDGDRRLCFAAGMDDYPVKPLVANDLIDVLKRWGTSRAPTLEVNRLKTLCAGYDEFLSELPQSFHAIATCALGEIAAAIEHGDGRTIGGEAHSLRGVCLTIGAQALAEIAKTLEELAKTSDHQSLGRLFGTLQAEWRLLSIEIESLAPGLPCPTACVPTVIGVSP